MSEKSQFFAGHIMLMAAALEQIAYIAAIDESSSLVIEQLREMRLILDEMISCGSDINPERIRDIIQDAQRKLSEVTK